MNLRQRNAVLVAFPTLSARIPDWWQVRSASSFLIPLSHRIEPVIARSWRASAAATSGSETRARRDDAESRGTGSALTNGARVVGLQWSGCRSVLTLPTDLFVAACSAVLTVGPSEALKMSL